MKKEDILRKLTSRKFWMAVAGFISGLIIACRGGEELAETVSGCIMSAAAVIAYIIGEGLADSAERLPDTVIIDTGDGREIY